MRVLAPLLLLLAGLVAALPARAAGLEVATIERPPFVIETADGLTGFSIDLWNALAAEMGTETRFITTTSFPEMLGAVENGNVDAAIANISITSARENVIDFSQPIFDSGLQILIPDNGGGSALSALFTWQMAGWILLGGAALFVVATLMWFFERRAQSYFKGSFREGLWPSFWWALNIVVNGGFEERVPRTPLGRIFATALVIASLFVVSLFVAKITTTMTVGALQADIQSLNDLYGKRVGTTAGSTSAAYLDGVSLRYQAFDSIEPMFAALEAGELDAVVHDAPILAYYARTTGRGRVVTTGNVFKPEKYGIALQQGSDLAEPLNRALLKLRENGTYGRLIEKWFGKGYP